MRAVCSVLDEASHATVEMLWESLRREFGVAPPFKTPIPHFTYHAAQEYDWMRLRDALYHVARDHEPFVVRTGGLGLFTGNRIVVHVPLVRTPAMNAIQRDLWRDLHGVGQGVLPFYASDCWIPHVTLAHGVSPEQLSGIVAWLAERSFAWEVQVTKLTLIGDLTGLGELPHEFELGG
jgi:hypothetical protein